MMNLQKQKEVLTGLVVPQNPSAGYIKELVFISVAYGLIEAAMEVQNEKIPNDGAITRQLGSKETKESRSLNQRINRRILSLQKEIKDFLHKHRHLYNRFAPKKDKLMNTILAHTKNVQLDFLCRVLRWGGRHVHAGVSAQRRHQYGDGNHSVYATAHHDGTDDLTKQNR